MQILLYISEDDTLLFMYEIKTGLQKYTYLLVDGIKSEPRRENVSFTNEKEVLLMAKVGQNLFFNTKNYTNIHFSS